MSALNKPNLIARGVALLALAGAIVAVVLIVSGGKTYSLNLQMANASGVRPGSQVLLGGVPVGTVNALNLSRKNVVIANLHLNPGQVRIGQGATASVIAANLLGEEYVALQPGNQNVPLPSGATLPESATTVPTDLDQVVDVLDNPTRADLAILLNEAGLAVAGRQSDVSAIVRQLPLSETAATKLLTTMVQDNHSLSDLVANSDQFITRINQQSGDLKSVVNASAGAVNTLAQRAGELKQTVQGAPGVLSTFTNFFVQGAPIVRALTPVAGDIASSAPILDSVLKQVRPFTVAAVPTLNKAASVSPTLTKLAVDATPTVKQAVPTIAALQNIGGLAQPLSAWVGLSASDFFNIFQGWDRAIQFRDGISHIFNGDVYFDPKIIIGAANQGATPAQKRQNLLDILNPSILQTLGLTNAVAALRRQASTAATKTPAAVTAHHARPAAKPAHSAPATSAAPTRSAAPKAPTSSGLGGLLGGLGSGLNSTLNGLTGGSSGSSGSTAGSSSSGSGGGSGALSSLQNLLNYLLGK